MPKKITLGLAAVGLALSSQVISAQPHYNVNDYYQIFHEGRIYVFDDFATYQDFYKIGEAPFRLTRIGAGSNGETVVFGLSGKDKNMQSGLGSVALFDGAADGINTGFYGEVIKDGRIYVFSTWHDQKDFLAVGEAPFRYTQIGYAPKGETVVFVLNENNKEQSPTALIAEFNCKHQM
jgi:hypothetical protein